MPTLALGPELAGLPLERRCRSRRRRSRRTAGPRRSRRSRRPSPRGTPAATSPPSQAPGRPRQDERQARPRRGGMARAARPAPPARSGSSPGGRPAGRRRRAMKNSAPAEEISICPHSNPPFGTVHDCASLGRSSARGRVGSRGRCHAAQRMAGDRARTRRPAAAKVAEVVDPVLRALGAEPDPHCWVAWGEEPAVRYTIFVPTAVGLIACYVRVNVSGEGPRATAKLIRWSRVQLGELSIETQAEHRLISFQVEQHVLHGGDEKADRIARFALELFAAVDGRVLARPRRARSAARPARPAQDGPARPQSRHVRRPHREPSRPSPRSLAPRRTAPSR